MQGQLEAMAREENEMNEDKLKLIIVAVLVGLAVVMGVVVLIVYFIDRHKQIVANNSHKLREIDSLNRQYTFFPLAKTYFINAEYDTKSKYDRHSLTETLCHEIMGNKEKFHRLIDGAMKNKEDFEIYNVRFTELLENSSKDDENLYEQYRFFKRVEKRMCNKIKQKPVFR